MICFQVPQPEDALPPREQYLQYEGALQADPPTQPILPHSTRVQTLYFHNNIHK